MYFFFQNPLILPQHTNQVQPIQCIAPPPPPSSSVVTSTNSSNPSGESRGGGGKTTSAKRNGNKGRTQKNLPQAIDKPPPPPPPPPPPQCNLHPAKGPRLLPQQQIITQAPQPIVFQTEHNGGMEKVYSRYFCIHFIHEFDLIMQRSSLQKWETTNREMKVHCG